MRLKVVQIFPLGPMVRVRVQVSEVPAVGLLPIGERRFHVPAKMHIAAVNASRDILG
jgi:hypothetical protein